MVVIDDIKTQMEGNLVKVSAKINADGRDHQVWFRWKGVPCPNPADALVAAAIQPAMRFGGKLVVKGTISLRLFRSLMKIQEIYKCWDRRLSTVDVEADDVQELKPLAHPDLGFSEKIRVGEGAFSRRVVGCAFSGGTDSFYTLLKHFDEIEALFFIDGFDISLEDHSLRRLVSDSLRRAASRLGKPLIEVQTNLKSFSNKYTDWELYNGEALTAAGIILSGHLFKLYIPSSHSYRDLFPWGSHPVLDPLFSTELIEFDHDGCEASRIEKIKKIANNDVAMDTLRVCWENRGGSYNCGRCEKCVRTMVNLALAGALHRCNTFDGELDLKEVAGTVPKSENARSFIIENIEAGKQWGADPKLLSALRRSLSRRIDIRPWTLYYRLHRSLSKMIQKPVQPHPD